MYEPTLRESKSASHIPPFHLPLFLPNRGRQTLEKDLKKNVKRLNAFKVTFVMGKLLKAYLIMWMAVCLK